jgi:hypothetical protein
MGIVEVRLQQLDAGDVFEVGFSPLQHVGHQIYADQLSAGVALGPLPEDIPRPRSQIQQAGRSRQARLNVLLPKPPKGLVEAPRSRGQHALAKAGATVVLVKKLKGIEAGLGHG